MRTILVYIGSRANYSSAKPVMRAIQARDDLTLRVALGGAALLNQYGNIEGMVREDGFPVDAKFHMVLEGQTPVTMAKSTGLGIVELSQILDNLRPDVVLVVGDRFDIMAPVIAATYMNIPVAHTMGGEVSGTIDESIRHAVTKMAHIHFPANEDAEQRILRLGESPDRVFRVGCPRIDLVREILDKHRNGERIDQNEFFSRFKGVGSRFDLEKKKFLLVAQHPVTTEYGSNRAHVEALLQALDRIAMPTIMLWPNVDAGSDEISKGIRTFREKHHPSWLHVFINLPVEIYVKLMDMCACMVGNSSSAIREGAYIGTAAVNVGTRQQHRQRGSNVVDAPCDAEAIEATVRGLLKNGRGGGDTLYGDGDAGRRIAEVLATVTNLNVQKSICF